MRGFPDDGLLAGLVEHAATWFHLVFALDPKGRFHKAKRLKERENPDRIHKKSNPCGLLFLAEREGFEPPVPLSTVVFKTTVIDHSTISPKGDKISANRMQKACFLLRRSLISQAIFLEIGCKGTAIL